MPPMHALLADPWVAAEIDAALEPYAGRLPPEELAWMRDQLAETLASDGAAARLLRRAHPRVVDESGEVPIGADARPGVQRAGAAKARGGKAR